MRCRAAPLRFCAILPRPSTPRQCSTAGQLEWWDREIHTLVTNANAIIHVCVIPTTPNRQKVNVTNRRIWRSVDLLWFVSFLRYRLEGNRCGGKSEIDGKWICWNLEFLGTWAYFMIKVYQYQSQAPDCSLLPWYMPLMSFFLKLTNWKIAVNISGLVAPPSWPHLHSLILCVWVDRIALWSKRSQNRLNSQSTSKRKYETCSSEMLK